MAAKEAPTPATTEAVTSAPLLSAAFFVGEACAATNAAFMACKADTRDPSACVAKGDAVTACAISTYVWMPRSATIANRGRRASAGTGPE